MALKNHSLTNEPKVQVDILAGLNEIELLSLRTRIDSKLVIDIGEMNLTEELGLQYRLAKATLESVINDDETPANQKAQLLNTMGALSSKIIDQRAFVYSAERLKRFEAAFLKILDMTQNKQGKEAFFDLYGEFLEDKGE